MILVDWQIKKYAIEGDLGIHPLLHAQINPNSYDLTLSDHFQIALESTEIDPYNKSTIEASFKEIQADQIWVEPNEFILGSSMERITLPPSIVGVIKGKSSLARLGLSIEDAGFVDAGFSGQITFEIKNNHKSRIKLYAGMPFAQIVFFATTKADEPYGEKTSSKYQNQEGATLSRYHENGQRRGY